jgi:hypothetical protein
MKLAKFMLQLVGLCASCPVIYIFLALLNILINGVAI